MEWDFWVNTEITLSDTKDDYLVKVIDKNLFNLWSQSCAALPKKIPKFLRENSTEKIRRRWTIWGRDCREEEISNSSWRAVAGHLNENLIVESIGLKEIVLLSSVEEFILEFQFRSTVLFFLSSMIDTTSYTQTIERNR